MTDAGSPPIFSSADPTWPEAAATALAAGAIVGLPTETVYGIGVLPRPEPVTALIAAKQRDDGKGIALLIDDLDQVEGLVTAGPAAHRLAAAYWPGALTLVLPLRSGASVPAAVTGGRDTLGVRLPDHDVPRDLARRLGPLAVSSANLSGEPAATTSSELVATVGGSLALVIDDGPVRGGVASTVVAVDGFETVAILRAGAIAADDIERTAAGAG